MDKYDGYKTRDLIDHHNAVAHDLDERPITKWKGSRDELIRRIDALETKRDGRPEDPRDLADEMGESDDSNEAWVDEPSGEGESDQPSGEGEGEADPPGEGETDQPSGEAGEPEAGQPSGFPFHQDIIETMSALREDKDPKAGTVQYCALHLLSVVLDVTEDKDGTVSWGASYDEVLAAIRELFPTAKTSVQSLRWYNSKVRRGDEGEPWDQYEVPDRRYQTERPGKAGRAILARCPDCQALHELRGVE